jgi:hypothetical protein
VYNFGSLVTSLSNGQSGEKCKLLAGVARAPLAGQRQLTQQSIFVVLPKIDTGGSEHRVHRAVNSRQMTMGSTEEVLTPLLAHS